MPTNFPVDKYIRLDAATTDIGGTLTWPSAAVFDLVTNVLDNDDDGSADINVDSWLSGTMTFTGYTINVGGTEFPVFLSGTIYVVPYNTGVDDIGATFPLGGGTTSTVVSEAPIPYCFLQGTQIATPGGPCAVEDLAIGDLVLTCDGRAVPIRFVGYQLIQNTVLLNPKHEPVRIAAGALGKGLPDSDLTLSADHAMFLDGLLINASALVNGTTIRFVPLAEMGAQFTYYHIETEAHEVILANGAASETFMDVAGRLAFDNYDEYLDLYGADRIIPEMKHHRIWSNRLLPDAIRAQLGITRDTLRMEQIA